MKITTETTKWKSVLFNTALKRTLKIKKIIDGNLCLRTFRTFYGIYIYNTPSFTAQVDCMQ